MPPRKTRTIKAKDLYRIKVVSGVRISPDGSNIIYSVQRVDKKTKKKYSNLWIAPTTGGSPRQFTFGDQSDSTPRWSPDGAQIAFLSNRADPEKPPQIYLLPIDGGEARQLTEIKGSITNFSWSGVFCRSKHEMMAFTHTDFPEPVVPAMSKCGIAPKSAATEPPETSFPSPKLKRECIFW